MVVLQALLTWLARSAGRFFQAAFGWAVVALFGPRPTREAALLAYAVAAAAAWPLFILGIVFPRIMSFVLAFVPATHAIPKGVLRAVWAAATLAVPAGIGALLGRDPRARTKSGPARIAEGFPATLGVACAFVFIAVAAPLRKAVALIKRRVSAHVPVVVEVDAYSQLAEVVEEALGEDGLDLARVRAPFAEEAPVRLLRLIGGPIFRRELPPRLVALAGSDLRILFGPNGLSIEGPEALVTRVRGLLAETLTFSLALQTLEPEAQKIERRIKALLGTHASGAARPARASDSLDAIARQLLAADVSWEDWQVLYRELQQAAGALARRRPLLSGIRSGSLLARGR